MNKVSNKFNEKTVNPLSLFSKIEKKYDEIVWEEITTDELEKLLNEIEIEFDISTIKKEEEKIEYLKYLLSKEYKNYIKTPSKETMRIISNIEALRHVYNTIGGKHDSEIENEIIEAIDRLKEELEKKRLDAIEKELLEEAEEQERLKEEDYIEDILSEEELLDEEDQIDEEDQMDDNDLMEVEQLEQVEDLDEEEHLDEDLIQIEDEEGLEDEPIEYNEDGTINHSKREVTINKDGSIRTKNYNKTTNKNYSNETINNNTTINNNSEEYINNENNDNSKTVNDLMERISQLESVLNVGPESNNKSFDSEGKENSEFANNSDFSSNNEVGEFSVGNDPFGEIGNKGMEFNNSNNGNMDFDNKESEFSFGKNSNNNDSSGTDQTQVINELMQRISSIESNKNKDTENKELKQELEMIKRNMLKIEKQAIQDNKLKKRNQQQASRQNKTQNSNKSRGISGFRKQPQTIKEVRTIQNNKITEIVKQSNLSHKEKERLKKELLSSIPNVENNHNKSSMSSAKTSMSPQEMENLVLVLADKLKLNEGNSSSQFQSTPMGNDPFASMGGGNQSDPFASMDGGNQSDPFGNMGGGANSDPFASMGGGGNSDPFASMGGGGNSDPFASMGGGNSDPFGNMGGGGNSDPFASMGGGGNSDPFASMGGSGNSDPFGNMGGGSDNSKNTASASDVSALQKQIKELQSIVLGSANNNSKPEPKQKGKTKNNQIQKSATFQEPISKPEPKEKPKDEWAFEPIKQVDTLLEVKKPKPTTKKKKFKLFDTSKTTKKGGDK